MHRIIVGVTSATLLFCTFGLAGGQDQNGDKDSSHPAFRVLNGSHASPKITLTELLDSYQKTGGGKATPALPVHPLPNSNLTAKSNTPSKTTARSNLSDVTKCRLDLSQGADA